ncbi:MAG: hypothetical protein V1781_05455 [Bacteroidota bacterium]
MATYPKIYSLCTVGIRQHFNSEYHFHSVRTDFTGNNGLGKSIIADLMQLIFIPRRDLWKPGTEGIDKGERRVEGIPLNKDYIQFAYSYLNIEKSAGKFITIGVYIPKVPRIPLRPFVIQRGENFGDKHLEPFDCPLSPDDFMKIDTIGTSKKMIDLHDLAKHLKEKKGLHLHDFLHMEGMMLYYDLLYKNNILPINLTRPDNLKTFAKILQSFSRAKTLDITNSKSLQNFLFEDNEEIRKTFEEQKEQLENLLKQYRQNFNYAQELQQKQKKLFTLKTIYQKSVDAHHTFLKTETFFAFEKYNQLLVQFNRNKNLIETFSHDFNKHRNEQNEYTGEFYKYNLNLKNICLLLKNKYESLKHEYSDEKIEIKKKEVDKLRVFLNLLSSIEPLYKKYKNIEAIKNKLKEQIDYRDKKQKLHKLLSIASLSEFVNSLWTTEEYQTASEYYQNKLNELPQQIEQLETLLELFEGTREDSFFHWAIQNNKPLSLAQETLLMYLKEVSINKLEKAKSGERYTVNTELLLNSYEEDEKGIWLKLGEIREFVPYITKQRFKDSQNLKTIIEKDKKEIHATLCISHIELKTIERLSDELTHIGFNPELSAIYKNRQTIQEYEIDIALTEEKMAQIANHLKDIQEIEKFRNKFFIADKEIIEVAKKQSDIVNKIKSIVQSLNNCEYNLNKLNCETNTLPIVEDERFKEKEITELAELKEQYESIIKRLAEQKIISEKALIITELKLKELKNNESILQQQVEELNRIFSEKKLAFESETGVVFTEQTFVIDNLNETIIEHLRQKDFQQHEEYYEEFTRVTETFEETKGNKSQELRVDKYNFHTLVNILCGKLGMDGLSPELERLNEELKKFGDLQLTIIVDVFKKVESQFNSFRKLVTELNFFFWENRISGVYHFQIDFNERKDITIDWIRKMRDRAKDQRISTKLFVPSVLQNEENSPKKLITNIAQSINNIHDCDIYDLLDPKFYFNLRVGLYDDMNSRYSGSGGEAYTAIALLCIGRMSIIQKDKNRPGIRFIIIEELSNIDDTNFGLFPEIAKIFNYQLMTMTPKPFGSYSESEWFLHMLIRGKDKNINYQPMSFFCTRNNKQRLEEYLLGTVKETVTEKIGSPELTESTINVIECNEQRKQKYLSAFEKEKKISETKSDTENDSEIKNENNNFSNNQEI